MEIFRCTWKSFRLGRLPCLHLLVVVSEFMSVELRFPGLSLSPSPDLGKPGPVVFIFIFLTEGCGLLDYVARGSAVSVSC